jgi:hypothetical protein
MDGGSTRGAHVAVIATLVAGSAAHGCSEPAPRHDTQKEAPIGDSVRTLDRHPDLTVVIRQGTEHFDNGQITLAIRGDGNATVEQLASGKTQHYAAKLPPARVAALGATLGAHRFTGPRTTTLPREPGDTQLVLRVDRARAPAFQLQLWDADRYKDADLDAILRTTDALIHELSGGALGQPAR